MRYPQAHEPGELPALADPLLQAPWVGPRIAGTARDVRPNPVVVERGEQLIGVTFGDKRSHLTTRPDR